MYKEYIFIKYIKDIDMIDYIDRLLINYISIYFINKHDKIMPDEIVKVFKEISSKYLPLISDNALKFISYSIRKDRIDNIISERLTFIVARMINEHNDKFDNKG